MEQKNYSNTTDSQSKNEYDTYGDGDIPEIDTTHFQSNATNMIPDEVPSRNSSGRN